MADTNSDAPDSALAIRSATLFEPLDAYTPPARRTSTRYVFGLLLVALTLAALLALYPAIILAVGGLLCWHAIQNFSIFFEPGWPLLHALVYFGPLFVGVALLVLLAKPLFARQAHNASCFSLNHADAPLLFALIGRLCRLTDAPIPSRVDVNCEVNASAGFRAGLRSLFGNDIVLTIGLPLVAGLSTGELAGVIAHELAHFRQGAGLRLTYLIRSANQWLLRLVFERDAWDVGLEQIAQKRDWRCLLVQPARACIWCTRQFLHLFLRASHALSCFMLRQMERDADQWQRTIAGWDAFESTLRTLHILNVASEAAQSDLRETWKSQRLPQHLPAYILHKQQSLPPELVQALQAATSSGKTRLFDTHPSPADRVAAAHAGGEPGIFRWVDPATTLFHDFDALSRNATRFFYEQDLQLPLGERSLIGHDEVVSEIAHTQSADEAMQRFFGEAYSALRPLHIMAHDLEGGGHGSRSVLAKTRTSMDESIGYAGELVGEYARLDGQILLWTKAAYLLQGGFTFDPAEFYLTSASHAVALRARNAAVARQKQIANSLAPFEEASRSRLCAALQLAPELAAAAQVPAEWNQEIPALVKVLTRFGEFHTSLLELRGKLDGLHAVMLNAPDHPSPERVERFVSSLSQEVFQTIRLVRDRSRDLPYPFPHARGAVSVNDYAQSENQTGDHLANLLLDGSTLIDRMFSLHYRIISRLITMTEAIERAVGPE